MFLAVINDIRDIKPPVYFKTSFIALIIIGIVILSALFIFLTVFIYRKFKKREKKPLGIVKSAHETAYEALEALRAKDLLSSGKIKEYFFELSCIVRRYIEDRLSIRAPEMTTEEFFAVLRDSEILSGTHKNLLKEFLSLCDIVKFARYGPTKDEIEKSFNAAKVFVDETKESKELEEVAQR
ncbi:MAG: hypothetical protein ISS34_01510 [Candidatus Omnitrophica bacterium]|nr:hypothetical protein [Candidatus Omnitrophota bacterium]